ncbi:hypothetical protein LUZ60_012136 [Juncus effusus]|nr:hypothetical protein LUZ60_012136 [Juncus effusus]
MADPTPKPHNKSFSTHESNPCDATVFDLTEEIINRDVVMYCVLDSIRSVRTMLVQIGSRLSETEFHQPDERESNSEDIFIKLVLETGSICEIGNSIHSKFSNYEGFRKKEKRELENSVLSLTEENRDLSRLLKAAVAEKEQMARKSKRGGIMQIAEKGLQRVGFGFVMGVLSGDSVESSSASTDSDVSREEEEEIISLSETVESIMNNLRNEIKDLRRALEESRSTNDELQALVEDQAQKLKENEMYTNDLEERERLMLSSVEELKKEVKIAGEEINRWREACELEVEAGKSAIKERNKELALLKLELDQTTESLHTSNTKLQLKQQLATTAMAAQSAAETCLRLADSRSASLTDRIEELTKQLEELEEERWKSKRRVRRVCWPCQGFGIPRAAIRVASWRFVGNQRSMPQMEALLRLKI